MARVLPFLTTLTHISQSRKRAHLPLVTTLDAQDGRHTEATTKSSRPRDVYTLLHVRLSRILYAHTAQYYLGECCPLPMLAQVINNAG